MTYAEPMWSLAAAVLLSALPARLDGSGFSVPVPEGFRPPQDGPSTRMLIDGGGVAMYWDDSKRGRVAIVVTPVNDGTEKTIDVTTDLGCAAIAKSPARDPSAQPTRPRRLTGLKYPACEFQRKSKTINARIVVFQLAPQRIAVVTCKTEGGYSGPLRGCDEVVNGLEAAK